MEKAKISQQATEKRLAMEQEQISVAHDNVVSLTKQLQEEKNLHQKDLNAMMTKIKQYESNLLVETNSKKGIEQQYESKCRKVLKEIEWFLL
jgi:hypothetical protein